MKQFKVKRKHLTGEIADFPRRVVQEMVDEQVRQGNPANPSVFARDRTTCKHNGGFTWIDSALGNSWADILWGKKFHLIPKREKKPRIKPNKGLKKMSLVHYEVAYHLTDNPKNTHVIRLLTGEDPAAPWHRPRSAIARGSFYLPRRAL